VVGVVIFGDIVVYYCFTLYFNASDLLLLLIKIMEDNYGIGT
jgi:hypothetical protein